MLFAAEYKCFDSFFNNKLYRDIINVCLEMNYKYTKGQLPSYLIDDAQQNKKVIN